MPHFEEDSREIKSILHDQWRNNNSLLAAQSHILSYLGPDPFSDSNIYEDECLVRIFGAPVSHLERALDQAIDHIGEDPAARSIPENRWNQIREFLDELTSAKALGSAILPFRLREIATNLRGEILLLKEQRPKAGLHKERINAVLAACKEMERLVCIFDLHRAIEMTKVTNERVFAILQAGRGGTSKNDASGIYEIDDVVEEVANYYRDQANLRGTEVRIMEYSKGAAVRVVKADLIKALGNLLDNAIKYTGDLSPYSRYEKTWIDIRIIQGLNIMSLRMESWGVPITDEEKKGDFIFKEGYRGWFARKTSVKGSGTGLADVRDFALENGGNVSFDSIPVRKASRIPNYTTTTVTLTLPLANVEVSSGGAL